MLKLYMHVGFSKGQGQDDSITSTSSLSGDGSNNEFIPPSHPNNNLSLRSMSHGASNSIIATSAPIRTKVATYKPLTNGYMAT